MKVFITGGGGFLGRYIIKMLLEKGHIITNYSRSRYKDLEDLGVRSIQGDLNDLEKLIMAMNGHDICFHVASKVAMWGKRKDFYQTNVGGTTNIIISCMKNKIKNLIYTSTPSVVFNNTSLQGADESTPYAVNSKSKYAWSKAMAEKLVLEANSEKLNTMALRPHLIFGPGDQNLFPRLITAAKDNKLKIIGNGKNKVDILYVENAAKAHIMAMETMLKRPDMVSGKAYFLGQGPIELWSFINEVLKYNQITPIKKKVSFPMAYSIGALIELGLTLKKNYNIHPPMTRFVALQLSKDHYFSHENAKKDFGWIPEISIEEGLSRSV